MPILDTVLGRFGLQRSRLERKAEQAIINDGRGNLPSIRVVGAYSSGAGWTSRDYRGQARDGYQRNSDVYACVSLIAQAAKQVKWWDGAGEAKTLPELLLKAIAPEGRAHGFRAAHGVKKALDPLASIALLVRAGGTALIENWVSYMLLSGNAFLEIERNAQKTPAMLFLDRPDRVTANPPGSQLQSGERPGTVHAWQVVLYGGAHRTVAAADIVHSRLFNPLDDIYGMPPLAAAMLRVEAQNEGGELLRRVFERGYAPGWLEAAENSEWTDEQVGQLRERIRLSKRAGQELFLQNAKWHQMGFNPVDSGITDQQLLTKRDIASVFHVDPALIGDTSTRTYATYRESRQALYMEAVIPLLTQFRDDWNRTIGRELQSPLDFDKDSFDAITAAREEATDRVTKLWTSGLITQAEGREDLEYDPPKPGDVFYAPANLVPLGDTGDTAPPQG